MKRIVPRGWRLPAATIAVLVAAGGAYAAIPDAAGVINGCYKLSGGEQGGQLRVVADPASCRNNETAIRWNERGTRGLPGPAGADGADGSDGASPTVAQLPAGDAHCAGGGAAITDASGTTAYVCNGATGSAGPAGADGTPFDGTFTSPNGFYSVSVTDAGVRIASPDSSIDVTGTAIRIETNSSDEIELRGASDVDIRSGAALALRAGSSATLTAGSTATLSSGAAFSVAGSLVRLGGGCIPAARIGDPVAGGVIVGGSTVVCLG